VKRQHSKNGQTPGSKNGKIPPFAVGQMPQISKNKLSMGGTPIKGPVVQTGKKKSFQLSAEKLVRIHDTMVKTRALEERLIKMFKQSDGYFWLGGPGEEAFAIPLGMQGKVGQGLDYDFWHLHYRSSGILMPMGLEPMDVIRQMKNVVTDPFSGGRNFCNHLSARHWNVVPITSTIETQYSTAIGSAIAQKRHGGNSLTVVTGGDAGTAEGDFASALVWSTRPGNEIPLFMIVTNNQWGISTAACTQHGDKVIADRGKAFGMKTRLINGLDVEESWFAIQDAMSYIRTERKPFLMEAQVTRMFGHSSATGANQIPGEACPIQIFETQLAQAGIVSPKEANEIRERYNAEMLEMAKRVKEEPMPDPSTIYDHTYFGQKGRYF
jgi:2-oxoisovalerate dehydrogenase E1 component alpha subunit